MGKRKQAIAILTKPEEGPNVPKVAKKVPQKCKLVTNNSCGINVY